VIIDFHVHIVPPEVKERRALFLERDPAFRTLYGDPRARLATAEDVIRSMEGAGVDRSLVSSIGWYEQEFCQLNNDYIMEAVAKYPDRLLGLGIVQPAAGEVALREVERCAEGGLLGIGELMPDEQQFDLGDVEMLGPLVELAAEHRMLLLFHSSEPVGHTYVGKGETTPDLVYGFLKAFPGLTTVWAHWGGGLPFYALMPEVAEALSNAYFDTAASPFLYRPQIFHHLTQIIGADRILLGSDYPLLRQERMIRLVRSTALSDEEKGMILGGNAAALLGLNDGEMASRGRG